MGPPECNNSSSGACSGKRDRRKFLCIEINGDSSVRGGKSRTIIISPFYDSCHAIFNASEIISIKYISEFLGSKSELS